MSRRSAYPLLVAACALPRLVVLLHERAAVLENMEKSDLIAQLYLKSGTFGYVPGVPSAYTQPLYGWFLIAVYWLAGKHWLSVGGAQTLVAAATAIVVYESGRRFLSNGAALLGAVIATLQPYLVWHDLHGNREILDQLLGAAMFGLAYAAAARRSLWLAAALGVVSGVAILSNTRLVLLPLALGGLPALAAFGLDGRGRRAGARRGRGGAVGGAEQGRGRLLRDHDRRPRSLEGEQPRHVRHPPGGASGSTTCLTSPSGAAPGSPFRWYTPEAAGTYYKNHGVKLDIDECAQQAHYEHLVVQFWEHHPGAKLELMAQATGMLWDPRLGAENTDTGTGVIRTWVEPLYVVPLYVLAIVGFVLVAPAVRALAAIFVLYETLAAWVLLGTTRYRAPWDFVLALLAAAALERLWSAFRRRRQPEPARPAATGRAPPPSPRSPLCRCSISGCAC